MPPVIEITASAQAHIEQILSSHKGQALQLGLNSKGCSGNSYTFDLIDQNLIKKFDEVINLDGASVVIPAVHVLKLLGSTLDWQEDKFGAKFVWTNPLVKNTCGCGESVGF